MPDQTANQAASEPATTSSSSLMVPVTAQVAIEPNAPGDMILKRLLTATGFLVTGLLFGSAVAPMIYRWRQRRRRRSTGR